jgi:hypothetical protein
MNKSDDRSRIDAILRHLGCGGALRDFPGTESEKLALIRIAGNRGLVTWHKGRGRYEVSPIGWSELTPRRRFGLGSLMAGTAVGATVGAAVLGFFWVSADAARLVGPSPVARAEKAIAASVAPMPLAPVPVAAAPAPQTASASPAAPAFPPAPASGALAGSPTEPAKPAKVAEQPVPPEPSAEAAPVEVKQAAVKKPRRKTVSRRRHDETGPAWASADSWRTRPSGYAGYGGQPSYGGQGFGFFR